MEIKLSKKQVLELIKKEVERRIKPAKLTNKKFEYEGRISGVKIILKLKK